MLVMNPGFLYAIGAAVTWGVVYCIDQKILTTTSALPLLFINSIITAILVLPFLFFDNNHSVKSLLHSGKGNLALVLLSILLATLANFLIFSGVKIVGASAASIIEIMYPFFVVLFSYFFFRTSPNVYFVIGAVLVFIGSALIVYHH